MRRSTVRFLLHLVPALGLLWATPVRALSWPNGIPDAQAGAFTSLTNP